jgi:hypothetical protein
MATKVWQSTNQGTSLARRHIRKTSQKHWQVIGSHLAGFMRHRGRRGEPRQKCWRFLARPMSGKNCGGAWKDELTLVNIMVSGIIIPGMDRVWKFWNFETLIFSIQMPSGTECLQAAWRGDGNSSDCKLGVEIQKAGNPQEDSGPWELGPLSFAPVGSANVLKLDVPLWAALFTTSFNLFFPRAIPTVTNYFVSSGSTYGTYFLTCYSGSLSGSLVWHSIYSGIYLASNLTTICYLFWHPIRHLFLHFPGHST